MSKPFLTPIDLNGFEIQNSTLQVLATAPASPGVGRQYYSSALLGPRWWNGTSWTNVATDSPTLNGQVPAYYLARANHTGSQTAATISDLATVVQAYSLSAFAVPTGNLSIAGFRLLNVGAPTASTDGANKQYVDDKVAGLSWKDEVQFATTANVALASGGLAAGQVIDGYTLQAGDRGLVRVQTAGSENGFYLVPASGAATRTTDADTAAKIDGAATFVQNGTTLGGQRYVMTNTGAIVLGTTALTFGQFGGGATYTNGNGIALAGNVFSFLPKPSGGIVVDGTGASLDTTIAVRKYATTFGDGSATSYTITHNLGTLDVTVGVYRISDSAEVGCDVIHATTNTVTLGFGAVVASNAMRAVVHG